MRPFRTDLFIRNAADFTQEFVRFDHILHDLRNGVRDFSGDEYLVVDRVVYTIQQSIGISLDLLAAPNSARKHAGNRFEELIRTLLRAMNIAIKKVVLSIPYDTEEGQKHYRGEMITSVSHR